MNEQGFKPIKKQQNEELQKILSSDNYLYGIKLLNQFNLYKYLPKDNRYINARKKK